MRAMQRSSAYIRQETISRASPELLRKQNWRRPLHSTIACQREKTVASFRNRDRAADETAPTTSSLAAAYFLTFNLAQCCARSCRQPKDADESGGILLVITLAHRE